MKIKYPAIELMSPAGTLESLHAAIQGGADSVYFGAGQMNMRSRSSQNFKPEDIALISSICHDNNVRAYLALNTVIYDNEIQEMYHMVDSVLKHNIDAVIASDISVLEYCRKQGAEVHISTQCNITNINSVRFYSQYADVIVTARELSLEQVSSLNKAIESENICGPSGKLLRTEVFVHGALCMAISGKCYISLDNFNKSANRGACYQPCRRAYVVTDKEDEVQLEIDNEYIMSPKDLCTIEFLDKIINSGVKVLKIEGRGRAPEYVKNVTKCYREAVDSIQSGDYTQNKIEEWLKRLSDVYNRGFWSGYYLGRKTGEWAKQYGPENQKHKVYVGKVANYFTKLSVAEIIIETNELNVGDEMLIIGPTTGVYEHEVTEIRVELLNVNSSSKGQICSVSVNNIVRRNDKVYKYIQRKI